MIDFPVTKGVLFGRGSLMLSFMLTLKRMLKACLR
ncbi:potassium channel protein, partial [Bacillus wiedmannii]